MALRCRRRVTHTRGLDGGGAVIRQGDGYRGAIGVIEHEDETRHAQS